MSGLDPASVHINYANTFELKGTSYRKDKDNSDRYTCVFLHPQSQFSDTEPIIDIYRDLSNISVETFSRDIDGELYPDLGFSIENNLILHIIKVPPPMFRMTAPHYYIFFKNEKTNNIVNCLHIVDNIKKLDKFLHGLHISTCSMKKLNLIQDIAHSIRTSNVTVTEYETMIQDPLLKLRF